MKMKNITELSVDEFKKILDEYVAKGVREGIMNIFNDRKLLQYIEDSAFGKLMEAGDNGEMCSEKDILALLSGEK